MGHSASLESRSLAFVSPSPTRGVHSVDAPVEFALPTGAPLPKEGTEGIGAHQSPLAVSHPGAWGQSPHYPESIAQTHSEGTAVRSELGLQAHFYPPPVSRSGTIAPVPEETSADFEVPVHQLTLICPRWGIVGCCEHGHYYAKELICNREWCAGCGGDGGKAHLRRTADKLPKARQMETMGKFTIPLPPEVRHLYRSAPALATLGIAFKRMLQTTYGFKRGIRRWHFFGEDHPGEGLQGDGRPVYHPHMEAIVDAGYLSGEMLYRIKRSVARILGVPMGRVVVHYQYGSDVAKKLHMLRYMLRPTFEKYEWDPPLAHALVGFKNAVSWGTWNVKEFNPVTGKWINGELLPPVWDIPKGKSGVSEVPEALQTGNCPLDGTTVTWGKNMASNLLIAPYWTDVGGGYWSWAGIRDGPYYPSPKDR